MLLSKHYDGGFTSSQTTHSDAQPSPAKSRDPQGAVPLTVKQISKASKSSGDGKSSLRIDGVDVTNVKLVGMIFDKTKKVTDVSFVLDDGTGRIGCKRWVNETFDRRQMEAVQNGMYVLLAGHLRTLNNNNEIVVFDVRLVNNFNEATLHYVECMHRHMKNKKLQPRADSFSQSRVHESSQRESTLAKSESNGFHSSPPNQHTSVDGLKDTDQRVVDYLQQPSCLAQEKGVHRDEIARDLKLPLDKIMIQPHLRVYILGPNLTQSKIWEDLQFD